MNPLTSMRDVKNATLTSTQARKRVMGARAETSGIAKTGKRKR